MGMTKRRYFIPVKMIELRKICDDCVLYNLLKYL